jgi:hypothetical protein
VSFDDLTPSQKLYLKITFLGEEKLTAVEIELSKPLPVAFFS